MKDHSSDKPPATVSGTNNMADPVIVPEAEEPDAGEDEPLTETLGSGAEDADSVARALAGDEDAFRELMDRHLWAVVSCAYSICGERERARDVAQEAFIEAAASLNELREPEKFGRWVYGIAKRMAIALVRKESRRRRALDLRKDELVARRSIDPPGAIASRNERIKRVRDALFRISEKYREVLVLKYVENHSYEEIAQLLNISLSAVDKRMLRGKKMLRKALRELGINPSGKESSP